MEITLGNKIFELREVIGRVVRADRLAASTVVHTPAHATPDGGSRAASTVSTTRVYENLQMQLPDGSPFSLEIWNTGLLAKEGDILHTLWIRRMGKKEEVLIAILDRTTGQEVWLNANFKRLFYLTEPLWAGIIISFIIGLMGMFLFGVIPFFGIFAIVLPVALPILTWRLDRNGRKAIAELKRIGSEGMHARRGETFPEPIPR